MVAQLRPIDVSPQVVPMTIVALRLLDENGFFDGDCNKHELIDGVLVMTPPPGTTHYYAEGRASRALNRALMENGLFETFFAQSGGAFRVGELTLLGPDLMIVPVPLEPTEVTEETIITLVEVSWSTRTNDLGPKAKIYAAAGIADYWVLDAVAKAVIVHRDPVEGIYTSVKTLKAPDVVTCLKSPQLSVAVSDLF